MLAYGELAAAQNEAAAELLASVQAQAASLGVEAETVYVEDAAPAELPAKVPWIRVPDGRKALAIAAANLFGHPAEALQLIAVTGTNGKTTTTSLV